MGGKSVALGRPRAFDVDEALDRALAVFWRRGYEGASLADLTRAMGISPPSLYAAFGNKEALFRRAVARYAEGPAAYQARALARPTARGVAEALLAGVVDLLTDPDTPPGCLVVQGALAAGEASEAARAHLAACRADREEEIRLRLERAAAEGDLPAGADPAALARFLAVVMFGLAVQAAGGAGRAELSAAAAVALRAWPEGAEQTAAQVTAA